MNNPYGLCKSHKFSEITVENCKFWPQLSMIIDRFTLDGHKQNWDVESQKKKKRMQRFRKVVT